MDARGMSSENQQEGLAGLRQARSALQSALGNRLADSAAYFAGLPRQIAAAAVVFRDEAGRILLVQPRYRPRVWQLAGGGFDATVDRFPLDTARREVKEELGLDLPHDSRLLAVDWVLPDGDRPPMVLFVFDGGLLTETEARERISLQVDELLAWRFCGPDEWGDLLLPHQQHRLQACVVALSDGRPVSLQHGRPVTGLPLDDTGDAPGALGDPAG